MLGPAAMLGAAAGEAVDTSGPGPSGAPTNVSTYNAGTEESPETGIQWTNTDPAASTGIGFSTSPSVDPSSVFSSVSPGVTSFETGDATAGRQWYVRHQLNGQFSAWVLGGAGV